jgi:hemoglobin
MPINSQSKSGLPGSIYEKLGGEDGIKIVVENTFSKLLADVTIRPFFIREGLDVEKIKIHFGAFLAHITSTTEAEWMGKPLANTHRHYPITDEIFDAFNSHCIQALRETRKLRIDGIREMIKML